jgi:hypothetical protein
MARLNRITGLLLVLLLVAAGASSQARAAEPINPGEDGWYTWRVASVSEFNEEQFFVLIKSGKPKEIEIVGRWCHCRTRWTRIRRPMPGFWPKPAEAG